jgi:hypothetical protein
MLTVSKGSQKVLEMGERPFDALDYGKPDLESFRFIETMVCSTTTDHRAADCEFLYQR